MNHDLTIAAYSDVLEAVIGGRSLTAAESSAVFEKVFAGEIEPAQLAALLAALRMKGETSEEIAGAAAAMTKAATPFPRPEGIEIGEIVGTGGDGLKTINVSTTAAIAAAGAGLYIAKHGNRGVSSLSGASDVLAALGVNIRPAPEEAAALLRDTGFCFCFAQLYHPAMRFAGPVRGALKVRTIFNVLGPLTNPAHPDYALIGVYDPALLETMAQTLRGLGMKRALVVHGAGLDEAAVHGETLAAELSEDGQITRRVFTPADFGVTGRYEAADVRGGAPEENARIAESVLSGGGTPAQHDMVAANLALLLLLGKKAATLSEAVELAHVTLRTGAGLSVLASLRAAAEEKEAA